MYESNKSLQKMALAAGQKAVEAAKANNIPITYLSGSDVVREAPDGSIVVIDTITPTKVTNKRFKLL